MEASFKNEFMDARFALDKKVGRDGTSSPGTEEFNNSYNKKVLLTYLIVILLGCVLK